ncbi:ATP-binding protein [Nocardia sp. NPDC051832]|uniref:sacsin N-terminal ATP-binding-like domain-containing protein n=1 Tax=Nocardia sp. NPDC051832 TaxID=3155673 RepID=UPI003428CE25
MSDADPFGTSKLRAGVLAAWRDSPTRLREDAATEADLVRAGYRDRLLTELAQNAADAAAKAEVPGRVTIRLDGRTLHITNTGAPLDLPGVHALTALRASGKADPTTVGRFGVGFTAVLSVSDDIEIRSTTGSLRFSRQLTAEALYDNGIQTPEGSIRDTESASGQRHVGQGQPRVGAADRGDDFGAAQGRDSTTPDLEPAGETGSATPAHGVSRGSAAPHEFVPPALRLAWPGSAGPETGADTEVVLRLRDDVDAESLLAGMLAEAADLLLELPALQSIRIGDDEIVSVVSALGDGLQELRIDGPGFERRIWWQYKTSRARWLLPVRGGKAVPAGNDVLRAPTRSDEELSLPAVLIADIPMQPDRRRLLPGARVDELAAGYADFARALPPTDRLVLVPAPGFARSEADGLIREAVTRELQTGSWLPVVAGRTPSRDVVGSSGLAELDGFADTAIAGESTGPDAVPTRASVFTGLTAELAGLLDDVVGPLVIPELSGREHTEALNVLDVHRLGLARLAELSSGLEREPGWWRRLYDALEPFVLDPLAAEELGALAVPLADGRVVTGPRTVVLDDQLEMAVPVHWARLVHPEAAHPLLARLGARSATAEDLLSDPGLRAELEERPADEDTVDAVLRLAVHANPALLPEWLGMLELPDTAGESRPADELLLPDAPLYPLLVADAPLGTVDKELVDAYGAEALRAIGVGWDFGVVTEEDPTGPDHHLDDEAQWWAGLSDDPRELAAVRDLDLVDEVAWPDALLQLVSEPHTRRLLADPNGYTAWWLRRHARIDGTPLGLLRHPSDPEFAGLLAEFDFEGFGRTDLDALRAVFADSRTMSPELAAALLAALADPAKTPGPEAVTRAHRRLAAAVAAQLLDVAELELPDRVRALSGAVIDPGDALILDQPWFALAVPPERLVFGGTEHASALAALLDLPPVSAAVTAEVLGAGRRTNWASAPLGVVLREMFTQPTQDGDLVLHDELRIRLDGAAQGTVEVPWWREGATTHVRIPEPR